MTLIEDFTGNTLNWLQPRAQCRRFELRLDGDTLASLKFETEFGSLALAETAEAAYTFKRVGFFRPRVTIRHAGSDEDLGCYEPAMGGGGILEMANGARYTFTCSSFWNSRWSMLRDDGEVVVDFFLKGFVKAGAQISFGAASIDAPLLALFGGYLMALAAADTGAMQTASVAVAQ